MSGPLLAALTFAAAVSATLLCGPHRFMRGRHVSAPLVRRIGLRRALVTRQVPPWAGLPFVVTGHFVPYAVLLGLVAAWAIDDWLFPDDDDDRRKRDLEWAKIRLRMPKPVKLRPAERWAGAPA